MKAWFDGGLHLVDGAAHLLFDPSNYFDPHPSPPNIGGPNLVLISHAHSDHCNTAEQYNDCPQVMHPATHDIMAAYRKIKKPVIIKRDGNDPGRYKQLKFKHLAIDIFDAGHCVGSVQFRVQTSKGAFVFTGDVNNDPDNIALAPATSIEANYLAIESTMGEPAMVAAPRPDTYRKIQEFLASSLGNGGNLVAMYGHAIGKGQEITKLVNSLGGFQVDNILVGNRTFNVNNVYEKYDSKIGKYAQYDSSIPPGKTVMFFDLYSMNANGMTVAKKFKLPAEPPSLIVSAFGDPSFGIPMIVLSSHADFNGLNRYVDESMVHTKEGGVVIPFHGSSAILAGHLRSRGYNAVDPHVEVITI
jgi:hypothetical protein